MKSIINAFVALLFLMVSCLVFMTQSYAVDCPSGEVDQGGVCVSSCVIFKDLNRTVHWDAYVYGDEPNRYCRGSADGQVACEMKLTGAVQVDAPNNDQYWTGVFRHTGESCPYSERGRFFGDEPLPFPFEGDANMNGIPDVEEDFDGDGIPNGVDPEPDVDNGDNADNNGNGVPDALDPYVDEITKAEDVKIEVTCGGGINNCSGLFTLADQTAKVADTNQKLVYAVEGFALNGVSKNDLKILARGVSGSIEKVSDITYAQYSQFSNQVKDKVEGAESSIISRLDGLSYSNEDWFDSIYSKVRKNYNFNSNINSITRDTNNRVEVLDREMGEVLVMARRNYGNTEDLYTNYLAITENKDRLDSLSSDLTVKIDGLADKLDGVSSGGTPTDGNGSQAIADSLKGISDSIDKLGQGTFTTPTASDTFQSNFLFSEDAFSAINTDIENLKTEYATQLNEFKSLLSVDISEFDQGEYVEHRLDLFVNGGEQSFKSGVLDALLDNSELIYAVIIFICVIAGLRMLGNS